MFFLIFSGILYLTSFVDFSDSLIALCLVTAIIFGGACYPCGVDVRARVFFMLIYFTGIASVQTLMPVLQGPDAHEYYAQMTTQSLNDLWSEFQSAFTFSRINFVSSTITFPGLLKTFGLRTNDIAPGFVAIPSAAFWIIASLSWVNVLKKKDPVILGSSKLFQPVLLFFLLILPGSVYWSSVFAKDIITISVFMFCAIALFNRRWLPAVVWLVLGTLLRPYAIAMIASLFLFLEPGWKKRIACLIGAFGILLIITKGNFLSIVNAITIAIYSFLSPNPFNYANWVLLRDTGTSIFSPALLTTGAVISGISFVVGVYIAVILGKRVRELFMSLSASILIATCVLTLISFFNITTAEETYRVGGLSVNIVRKKLNYWPLIVTWVSLTWVFFLTRIQGGLAAARCSSWKESSVLDNEGRVFTIWHTHGADLVRRE